LILANDGETTLHHLSLVLSLDLLFVLLEPLQSSFEAFPQFDDMLQSRSRIIFYQEVIVVLDEELKEHPEHVLIQVDIVILGIGLAISGYGRSYLAG